MPTEKKKFIIAGIAVPILCALIAISPSIFGYFFNAEIEQPVDDNPEVSDSDLPTNSYDGYYSDKKNYCLSFDGENDFAIFPNAKELSLHKEFTVELWVNPKSPNENVEAFIQATEHTLDEEEHTALDSGWILAYRSDRRALFTLAVSSNAGTLDKRSIFSPKQFQLNKWQHVAVTYDLSQFRMYIDGSLVNEEKLSGRAVKRFDKLLLGTWAPWHLKGAFHGSIDEVRLWNVARNAKDIAANKEKIMQADELGLVAYWRMDSEFGQTVSNSVIGGIEGFLGDKHSERDYRDPDWIISDCPVN